MENEERNKRATPDWVENLEKRKARERKVEMLRERSLSIQEMELGNIRWYGGTIEEWPTEIVNQEDYQHDYFPGDYTFIMYDVHQGTYYEVPMPPSANIAGHSVASNDEADIELVSARRRTERGPSCGKSQWQSKAPTKRRPLCHYPFFCLTCPSTLNKETFPEATRTDCFNLLTQMLELPTQQANYYLDQLKEPEKWIGLCSPCVNGIRESVKMREHLNNHQRQIVENIRGTRPKLRSLYTKKNTQHNMPLGRSDPQSVLESIVRFVNCRRYPNLRAVAPYEDLGSDDKFTEVVNQNQITSSPPDSWHCHCNCYQGLPIVNDLNGVGDAMDQELELHNGTLSTADEEAEKNYGDPHYCQLPDQEAGEIDGEIQYGPQEAEGKVEELQNNHMSTTGEEAQAVEIDEALHDDPMSAMSPTVEEPQEKDKELHNDPDEEAQAVEIDEDLYPMSVIEEAERKYEKPHNLNGPMSITDEVAEAIEIDEQLQLHNDKAEEEDEKLHNLNDPMSTREEEAEEREESKIDNEMPEENANSAMYACPNCPDVKNYGIKRFAQHLAIHQRRQYKCSACSELLPPRADLQKHWNEKHSTIKISAISAQHSETHPKMELVQREICKCEGCNTGFTTEDARDSHELKKKRKRNPIVVPNHITTLSGEPLMYHCNVCDRKFKTKAHIKYHEFCEKEDKPFKCKTCGQGFIAKSHYEYHIRTHTGERPYICPECGKGFNQQGKVTRHLKSHTGEKSFVCEECNRGFYTRQALRCHTLVHTGERPYACKYCNKRFTGMTNLKKHVIIHTGERPFSCDLCRKTFGLKWTLDLHRKTHSSERPYACDQCPRAFSNRKDLRRHLVIHSGMRPFKCWICGTSFRRKDNLDRHIRQTHKQRKEVAKQLANQAAAEYLKKNSTDAGNIPDSRLNSIAISNIIENYVMPSGGMETSQEEKAVVSDFPPGKGNSSNATSTQ